MAEPRKKKKQKTGRPLEKVPMRTLVKRVRDELGERIKMSFFAEERKTKQD
jgi:hypothetical protein